MSQLLAGRSLRRLAPWIGACLALSLLSSCGGGGGSKRDSGPEKTNLRVEAVDLDGDTLSYQWRVTGGTVENRNAPETVWTMPDGPGLHFAYVTISDGRGGYVEQQYAVSSDALNTQAAQPAALTMTPPTVAGSDEFDGASVRLRVRAGGNTAFAPTSGTPALRYVYLPDVQVRIVRAGTTDQVFAGTTDLAGEVVAPRLPAGQNYDVLCTSVQGAALRTTGSAETPPVTCGSISGNSEGQTLTLSVVPPSARNLRLFGHIGLSDGGACGWQSEFFGIQTSATVQVLLDDNTAATTPIRVNRFGDYALDAAVPLQATLKLRVRCDGASTDVGVTRPGGGYLATALTEQSQLLTNQRPQLRKMVASGPDGNVRGQMVLPLANAYSQQLPGAPQFLTYKGQDTRLSACQYYRAFGAVSGCDPQGRMIDPITLDDWKREHKFKPYDGGQVQVDATYVNERDLNLVRRMSATKSSANKVAFYVCNSPGPEGHSQRETDRVIDTGLADEKRVACVAMEYSPTPGRSGGQAFTKFLTFGPDGRLLPSINLDGRGEKYMPGACVACHGGASYQGRFPETGNPSPDMKSTFLPFDTGNYLFSTRAELTEALQSASIRKLNDLVLDTQPTPATQALIQGWYQADPLHQDKQHVPAVWASFDPTTQGISATVADSSRFYRQVVGTSCRTCHVAMRETYNWDSGSGFPRLMNYRNSAHICGGGADVHVNASMPNALISRDLLQEQIGQDASLAALMQAFLGCSAPTTDPVYPKR